jgi:predicted 2-oxoglutarate/Fe(II)-dependent dioxygenase YbiX
MLRAPEAIAFMSALLGERRYAEGAQVHRMPPGASLARHHHGVTDVFAVFHFSHDYSGGAYFEERHNQIHYPEIPPFSLFISRGAVVHGVEPITRGERRVLVTLWSESAHRT